MRTPPVAEIRRFRADELERLTPRELQVLQRITQSYDDIGEALDISPRTVKVHVIHALAKLRITRYEACAAAALTWGHKR